MAHDLVLMHYAETPVTLDRARLYEQTPDVFKPRGLWVSVRGEADWPEWCQENDHHMAGIRARHRVQLAAAARILVVATGRDLIAFNLAWGGHRYEPTIHAPNWPRLAAQYDGIVIAPHQAQLRLTPRQLWYASWDCASGCIWNLDAIAALTLEGYRPASLAKKE